VSATRAANSAVVLANAGTHNHRWLSLRVASRVADTFRMIETEVDDTKDAATPSNHILEHHPSAQPQHKPRAGAQHPAGNAVPPPQQRAGNPAQQQPGTAKDQRNRHQAERIVEDADVRHRRVSIGSSIPLWRVARRTSATEARGEAQWSASSSLLSYASDCNKIWQLTVSDKAHF
jgi:type IV secretory pathway VirB10-like protein